MLQQGRGDLQLKDFGYTPSRSTRVRHFAADASHSLPNDDARSTRDRPVSPKDATHAGFSELLERAAGFLRPIMLRPPPALGSRSRRRVRSCCVRPAAPPLGRRDLQELFRIMTCPSGDCRRPLETTP